MEAPREIYFLVMLLLAAFHGCFSQTSLNDSGLQCFGMHALIGAAEPTPLKAIALLQESADSNVTGVVFFTQNATGSHTAVHGIIQGLQPGLHGLHIQVFGDLSSGCNALGPHYNPLNRTHSDISKIDRHAGDLGNIEAAKNGVAEFLFADCQIPLRGSNSILGRAIVVRAQTDDLGQGGNPNSHTTGNAGAPVACGIIAVRYHL